MLRKPGEIDLQTDLVIARPPSVICPEAGEVAEAVKLLASAKRPLVILGKGAAYSRAEEEIREFVKKTNLPFLPTPMGKGVISDNDPNSVAPAR